jgi:hypothetical protein
MKKMYGNVKRNCVETKRGAQKPDVRERKPTTMKGMHAWKSVLREYILGGQGRLYMIEVRERWEEQRLLDWLAT